MNGGPAGGRLVGGGSVGGGQAGGDSGRRPVAGITQGPLGIGPAGELAGVFKALGDPVRLRLLSMIASAADGEICVCDLSDEFPLTGPTISHHLRILREAGLVHGARRGTWVYYRAVPSELTRLAGVLDSDRQTGVQVPQPVLNGAVAPEPVLSGAAAPALAAVTVPPRGEATSSASPGEATSPAVPGGPTSSMVPAVAAPSVVPGGSAGREPGLVRE